MSLYFFLFLGLLSSIIDATMSPHYRHVTARPETGSSTSLINSLLSFNNKKGFLSVQSTYGKTYNSDQIAKTILDNESIELAGSQLANRNPNALIADYFGLSNKFHSKIRIKPVIHSWQTTLTGQYQFFNEWTASFNVTLGINSYHLNLKEQIADDSQNTPYESGMMAITDTIPNPLYTSFSDAVQSLQQCSFLNKKESGLLESKIQIKKNWWRTDESYGQAGASIIIPSKEHSETITLFEPTKGMDHHWALGLSFEGSKAIWQNFEHTIAVNGIVEGFYLFKRKTTRTFDFKQNGFLSRYLLLKEFDNGSVTNVVQASTILTRECKVSLPLLIDGTLLFTYQNNNCIIGLGYNGFIRSTEKISSIEPIEKNKFGIKGLTPVFDQLTDQPNNATQSTCTLSSTDNNTDESTIYISSYDLNKKSAATSLSVIHSLCSCLVYKSNTEKNETFFGLTITIEFEGLEERFNNSTCESDPTFFRFGLTGGFIF